MSNIVTFVSRADKERITDPIYECPCGSQQFSLRAFGAIECAECLAPHAQLLWAQHFQSTTFDNTTSSTTHDAGG